MLIAVLAATGRTGRHLLAEAAGRGHQVLAVARDPRRVVLPPSTPLAGTVTPVHGDVLDPGSIAAAVAGSQVVLSGLGAVRGGPPGVLTAGATALAEAARGLADAPHVIWLGAYGTGRSAAAAGPVTRALLRVALGDEIADKLAAEELLLALGATVLHAGPLTGGPISRTRRALPLSQAPRRLLPRPVSRATVAALMLDLAERPTDRAWQPTDRTGQPTDRTGQPTDRTGQPTDRGQWAAEVLVPLT